MEKKHLIFSFLNTREGQKISGKTILKPGVIGLIPGKPTHETGSGSAIKRSFKWHG